MLICYENNDNIFELNMDISTDSFTKRINFCSFENYMKNHQICSNNYYLLKEDRFNFYSVDIYQKRDTKFTIWDFKSVLEDKKQQFYKEHWRTSTLLFYDLDSIFIDWEKQKFVINQKWDIYFRLNMIFLDTQTLNLFKINSWNKLNDEKKLNIYPSRYFTIKFIEKTLEKQDFNLFYIDQKSAKLLIIKNWFYRDYYNLNLWKDKLKDIFEDNSIQDLYYNNFSDISWNELKERLLKSSLEFYTDMVSKWLGESVWKWENIIFVSDLLKNKYFLDIFIKFYSKYVWWYILPFNYSNKLNTYHRKWLNDYVDILTCINSV